MDTQIRFQKDEEILKVRGVQKTGVFQIWNASRAFPWQEGQGVMEN
jgi:hypothetical protein